MQWNHFQHSRRSCLSTLSFFLIGGIQYDFPQKITNFWLLLSKEAARCVETVLSGGDRRAEHNYLSHRFDFIHDYRSCAQKTHKKVKNVIRGGVSTWRRPEGHRKGQNTCTVIEKIERYQTLWANVPRASHQLLWLQLLNFSLGAALHCPRRSEKIRASSSLLQLCGKFQCSGQVESKRVLASSPFLACLSGLLVLFG
jgi:hypothetical protein